MTVTREDVVDAVRGWLRDNVSGNRQVPEDYPLVEEGVLASLQTVELVLFLEEKFGVSIDESEVNDENFRSIATIAQLVASKRA